MKHVNFGKKLLVSSMFLLGAGLSTAQNYAWIKGSNMYDQPGTYGSIGVSAPSNNPGGRDGAVSWKDAAGNFWLFGGEGYDAMGNYDNLNDLWKYNPTTNEWTWINGNNTGGQAGVYGTIGVSAASNKPGARYGAVAWADASGNFWMFGGIGYDAFSSTGELNDLWKYTISTNQWTWMKGSNTSMQSGTYGTQGTGAASNVPGSRGFSNGWTDASGNFWLFGGNGFDGSSGYGSLNDLWKYSQGTNQWTWMKGNNTADQNGVYGTLGTGASGNNPGGRASAATWADGSGNLWLLGGYGFDASSTSGDFINDQWKYSISSNQWTWVAGSNIVLQNGSYGTLGILSSTNIPGARVAAQSWTDASGNFYLFGGVGLDATASFPDYLNDLWKYSPTTNQWAWIKGSNTQAQSGTYGTQGAPAAANTPGARFSSVGWTDSGNNLWLFGGSGNDATAGSGELNDLWKLYYCAPYSLTVTVTPTLVCAGQPATLTASGASSYTWSTASTGSVLIVPSVIVYTPMVVGSNTAGCMSQLSLTLTGAPLPTVNLAPTNTLICFGGSATVTASGASSYSWSNGATGTTAVVTNTVLGAWTITCFPTGANGCKGAETLTLNTVANPTIQAASTKTTICKGEVVTLTVTGTSSYSWNTTPSFTAASISVSPAITTTYVVTGTDANGCKTTAAVTQSVNDCSGLNELSANRLFSIYPNPGNGEFTVRTELQQENMRIVIVNAIGQTVFEQPLNDESTFIKTRLSTGLYYFQVVQNDKVRQSGKLIIE
jgi:N-acetylneuraminic acid mutarotase